MQERPQSQERVEAKEVQLNENGLENLSEEERKAWRLLIKRHRDSAIKPEDFSDLYDKEALKKDLDYVQNMEEIFKDKQNSETAGFERRGELLEALLAEGIKSGKWLGADTIPIIPSRYDDIWNKIDLILEMVGKEGFSHLALNIDITSSPKSAEDKLTAIRGKILLGELSQVKYFRSNRANIRGTLESIPKVIIGIDPKHIRELCLNRIEIHTFKNGLKRPENQASSIQKSLDDKLKESTIKFVKSIVRHIIIREIEVQLTAFADYADKMFGDVDVAIVKKRKVLAEKYRSAYETLQRIKGQEAKLDPDLEDEINNDKVFESIRTGLRNFEIK